VRAAGLRGGMTYAEALAMEAHMADPRQEIPRVSGGEGYRNGVLAARKSLPEYED
jgi:hypothetical protein